MHRFTWPERSTPASSLGPLDPTRDGPTEVQDTLENPELAFWGGVVTGAIFVSLLICLKRRGTKRMEKRGGNTVESWEFMVHVWFTCGESMDNLWVIYG